MPWAESPTEHPSAHPGEHRITLLGKPGCHLCDDARAVVARVAEDLAVPWEERSILGDEELMATVESPTEDRKNQTEQNANNEARDDRKIEG